MNCLLVLLIANNPSQAITRNRVIYTHGPDDAVRLRAPFALHLVVNEFGDLVSIALIFTPDAINVKPIVRDAATFMRVGMMAGFLLLLVDGGRFFDEFLKCAVLTQHARLDDASACELVPGRPAGSLTQKYILHHNITYYT